MEKSMDVKYWQLIFNRITRIVRWEYQWQCCCPPHWPRLIYRRSSTSAPTGCSGLQPIAPLGRSPSAWIISTRSPFPRTCWSFYRTCPFALRIAPSVVWFLLWLPIHAIFFPIRTAPLFLRTSESPSCTFPPVSESWLTSHPSLFTGFSLARHRLSYCCKCHLSQFGSSLCPVLLFSWARLPFVISFGSAILALSLCFSIICFTSPKLYFYHLDSL